MGTNFQTLFNFLEDLQQNNSKEWMDMHRSRYYEARDFFIHWLDDMNETLAHHDPDYFYTPGKKAINRINNNLMFHPNRPVYKDHFGAGLDQLSKQGDFYIEVGLSSNFVGGGYWHPSSEIIRSIREAIDYNGDNFKAILNKESFKTTFGGLVDDDKLKTAPKGFSQDHEHIDLLRMKSFAVARYFTREEVLSPDFRQKVISSYMELLPFRRYLNKAVTV